MVALQGKSRDIQPLKGVLKTIEEKTTEHKHTHVESKMKDRYNRACCMIKCKNNQTTFNRE
uniref:Uncharacterized protein n=1 Tax=Tetranychus urticae TaxID=32264 RepID=T1L3W1_TETUR